MSSVMVSGDSSEEAPSQATGGEGNPIELDDSSSNSSTNSNSNTENETPPGPIIFKQEETYNEERDESGVETARDNDNGDNDNDNDSGEDGDGENSEGDDDVDDVDDVGEINNDADETMDESAEGVESENENENKSEDEDESEYDDDKIDGENESEDENKSDGENDDDVDNEDDDDDNDDDNGDNENENDENDSDSDKSGSSDSKDVSEKELKRRKKMKNLWGNIESMSKIIKSPYEGNECAEVGEDCFEEFRLLLDCSETNGAINPRLIDLVGDKLAQSLCNAHHEIGKSGMLYSANWKEGKIRDSDFGWIPKRQLLLCLHEHRFAKGGVVLLQAVTKSLDCTKLVLEAMKLWDLMDAYPNLASNKNEETFAFGPQKVLCYKCQIFVARAFATLQILNKTEGVQQSLTKKIKACLGIMNEHVRVNQIELARMTKKSRKRKALEGPTLEEPNVDASKSPSSKRSVKSASRKKAARGSASPRESSKPKEYKPRGPRPTGGPKKTKRKRRRMVPKREEREESIYMMFNTMQMHAQRLNMMMSYFQTQLQDHGALLKEEIREKLEKEGKLKR